MAILGIGDGCTSACRARGSATLLGRGVGGVWRPGMTSLCLVGGSCDAVSSQGSDRFDVFTAIEANCNCYNRDGNKLEGVAEREEIKPQSNTSTWHDRGPE